MESKKKFGVKNFDLNRGSGGHFGPQRKNTFMGITQKFAQLFLNFFYFWKVHELGFNLWVWIWVIPEIFLALGPFEIWLKMAKNDPQNENGPL